MKKNNVLILCILLNTFTLLLPNQASHPLFQAAREGKRDVIKKHLENNENCAIKDEKGNNLLHIAAENGHAEIIEDLTEYRGWWQHTISGPTLPNVNDTNNDNLTPLETSIENKQYDAMIVLLEAKKDKKTTNNEQLAALITGADKDDPSSIYLLEHYGYNPLLQNSHGTILHYGIRHNKKKIIGYCARKAVLINAKNQHAKAPIVLSVEKKDENEIDFLAYLGADVNISGENGMKPMHFAKTPCMVDCLLRNKAWIDPQDDDGHTPLHYKISHGNDEMVDHLINNKADIKKRNNKGEAAFAIAVRSGHQHITQKIAAHPDSDINEQDINGQTRYIVAAREKNLKEMEELIGYGINRAISDNLQENALHKLAQNGFIDGARLALADNPSLLTATNNNGDTPLFTAIQYGHTATAQLYTAHNASVNIQNNNGETVLHEAAKTKNVTLIIEYIKKNVPVLRNKQDKLFYHYCAELGDLKSIIELKRLNIPLNDCAPGRKSTLYLALEHNQMHCVPELLYPYMINYKDNDGIAPLSLAARHGNIQTINSLLQRGAHINDTDNNKFTAMHHAAYYNQPDAIKTLKDNDLSPLACDKYGNTPTHIAAQRGSLAALDFCIKYNWQTLSIPNNNNETPFITAARHGQERAATKLLRDTDFINNDIDKAIDIAHRHENHATARALEKEKEQRIDECKKDTQIMRQAKDVITKNNNFKSTIKQKRPREYVSYIPPVIEEKTWEQLYKMPTLERIAISTSNSYTLMQETIKHVDLNKRICAIELEESKLKLEQITAEAKAAALRLEAQRKQEAEQHARDLQRIRNAALELENQRKEEAERVAIEQQRIRVAQHKEEQKRQEEQRAKAQAQATNNNVQIAAQQNQAPNVAVAEKAEDNNARKAANPIECFICFEEKPLIAIPCEGPHSDLMCSDCVTAIKNDKNECPLCRKQWFK